MKKLLAAFWILFLLPFCLSAQTDTKAEEVLDKVLANLSNNGGIRADFEGTEKGFLLMKGEQFYLNSRHVQCWYDGETQWSYVTETEEVNISNPTFEELLSINPYLILKNYKKNDFNYIYKGNQTRNGVKGHEIVLTPKHTENQATIRLFISKANQPLAMKIERNGQTVSDINITSYRTNQQLADGIFRFNKSLYPNVEIIDLR